jgi:hypothetical protein
MLLDEKWPRARLIPISKASGVEAEERRAASALLAVIAHVEEFGRSLLKPLGAPVGRVQTFIEVPFKLNGKPIRPDGVITVTRGEKTWAALVETKTSANSIVAAQIDSYLDVAREYNIDSLISISNEYVSVSSDYPVEVDKRKLKKVNLVHWSWVDVLTEAVVQSDYRGVRDVDQAYILQELIRYLKDRRSGVLLFHDMGPSWVKVRDGARDHSLRRNDDDVAEVAFRWDQLARFVALELTMDLGLNVRHVVPKTQSPAARHAALRESLANTGKLDADFNVPNSTGYLHVEADLRSRQVIVSTSLDAPKDGRSKGRVSWMLRQLQKAPETLKVEVKSVRRFSLAQSLATARGNPESLYPDAGKDIRQFTLTLTKNVGTKRGVGRGSFIDSIVEATKGFYGDVLQNLRPWKAAPPKLKKAEEPDSHAADDLPGEVAGAVEDAAEEMQAGKAPEFASEPGESEL